MAAIQYQIQLLGAPGASVTEAGPAGIDGKNGGAGADGQSSGWWRFGKCVKPAEDGKPGESPAQPHKADDGGNGANSPTLNLTCKTIVGTLSILVQGGKGGDGGSGGPGGNGGNGGNGGKQPDACSKQHGDTQGGIGGNGGQGGDAGAGGKGGDCGNVTVLYDDTIANPIQNMDTANAAGSGGKHGLPGKGGAPGIGGMSGSGKNKRDDGIAGRDGNIALSGSDGNTGQQTVSAVSNPDCQLVINVTGPAAS